MRILALNNVYAPQRAVASGVALTTALLIGEEARLPEIAGQLAGNALGAIWHLLNVKRIRLRLSLVSALALMYSFESGEGGGLLP
jgi:hypothetical protein